MSATNQSVPQFEVIAEHLVKRGETLSHIALRYYGSATPEKWMTIYDANCDIIGPDYNIIVPGQRLKIPRFVPKVPPVKIITEYEIKRGDSLSQIAFWHYGTDVRSQWVKMYKINGKLIGSNPYHLRAGQTLKIPDPRDDSWFMRSDQPMRLSFKNNGALACSLFWVNFEGQEVWRANLDIGQTVVQDTFESHEWIVRDTESSRLITTSIATRDQPIITISTEHLRSASIPGEKISIVVWNYTSLTVDLYQVESNGKETLLNTYDPDDNGGLVDMTVSAVLRVREHKSQDEVNIFVVTADRRREYMVGSPVIAGHPRTTLAIHNDTGLTIDVYRKFNNKDGKSNEKYHRSIDSYNSLLRDTYATYEWVLRDHHSGFLVGQTVVQATSANEVRVTTEALRSAGGNQPIAHLSLKNSTSLWIDIYKVDAKGARLIVGKDILPNTTFNYDPANPVPTLSVGDALLITERSSGSTVAAYILGSDGNDFDITLKTFPTHSNGTIEIYNAAPLKASLQYWDETGQSNHFSLQSGQRVIFPTDAGTPWMATLNGLPLGLWHGKEGDHSYMITTHKLRSLPVSTPASLSLINNTHYRIEIHTITSRGDIILATTGEPETIQNVETTLFTAFIVRDADTGADLLMSAVGKAAMSFNLAEELVVTGEREGGVLFPGEVALYSEPNFQGSVWIVRTDFPDLKSSMLGTLDDTVSSIKVGSGTGITLFEDTKYDGKSQDYFVNISKLSNLDKKVSSFKVWIYSGKGSEGIHATTGIWTRNLKLDLDYKYIIGETSVPEEFQHPGEIPAISFLADTVPYFWQRLKRTPVNWFDIEQVRALVKDIINWHGSPPQWPTWADDPTVLKYIAYWWRIRTTNLASYTTGVEKAKQVASRVRQNMPLSDREEHRLTMALEETCQHIIEDDPTRIPSVPALHFESDEKFYRCIVNFAPEVNEVEITSMGDTRVSLGYSFVPISATSPYQAKPNAGRLVILLQADTIGKPVLKLRTNTMAENEAYLVYPDAEVYRNFNQLGTNALWEARGRLGINADEASCQVVEQTLRNLSSSIAYANPAGKNINGTVSAQIDGRMMEYSQWISHFDDSLRFQPLSPEEYAREAQNAKRVDLTSAQGWDDFVDFLEDVGETFVDAGKGLVAGVEWVAVRVYKNIIIPATNVAKEVIDKAIEYGQAAVNIVAKFGDKALNYIEQLGKTAFNTMMALGEAGWEALMALPTEGLEALAKFGTKALNTLVKSGMDVVNFTAQLGKEGLGILKEMGKLGIQLALEIKQGLESAAHSMADFLSSIHPALGQALEMTLNIGGEIITFVANVGKQVGKIVTLVVNKIGVLAGEFVGWIASEFGWDDVIKTQKTLTKLVNDGLSKAIDFVPGALDDVLVKPWSQVTTQLKSLIDQTGIQAQKPMGLNNMVASAKAELADLSEFNWLLNEMGSLLPQADPGITLGELLDKDMLHILDELIALASDARWLAFNNDLEQPLQRLKTAQVALQDPAEIPQQLLNELLGPVQKHLDTMLDFTGKTLGLMVKLLRAALLALRRIVNVELELPGLSGFIEGLTDQKPTALNLATILVSIPLTSMNGPLETLPSLAMGEDSETDGNKRLWEAVISETKFASALLGPALAAVSEALKYDKHWKLISKSTNIILDVIYQIKIDESWKEMFKRAKEAPHKAPANPDDHQAIEDFLWLCRWGMLSLDVIGTIASLKLEEEHAEKFDLLLASIKTTFGVPMMIISGIMAATGESSHATEENTAEAIGCIAPIVSPMTEGPDEKLKVVGWALTSLSCMAEGSIWYKFAVA